MTKIYFAAGCFWGAQGYFDLLKGVKSSRVGYANSEIANPSYEMVCSGFTNAAECVEVVFDENILSLQEIVRRFFSIIDPFSINRQGNDVGTQYRSGVYADSQNLLDSVIQITKAQFSEFQNLATEFKLLSNFYEAENYHQKYLQKNPNGYCHIDIFSALKPL